MLNKTLFFAVVAAANTYPDAHGDAYIEMSASDKLDQLWEQITSDTTSGTWANLANLLKEDMDPTFDAPGDDMPCDSAGCRTKDIHSVGVISKVKFVAEDSPFSGIFKGADYGLVRFSTATPYNPAQKLLKPGMGLKFLRDGVDSANLVSMYSVDGQDSWNFFKNDWSNHIPALKSPSLAPLAEKFSTASNYIQSVGLSNLAQYDQTGVAPSEVVFPFSLRFEPMTDLQESDDYTVDPLDQLVQIPSGTTIWEVYAMDAPQELGGQELFIGSLVTTSETVKSLYSDEKLFFRHQLTEDDIALKPEWTDYYVKYTGPPTGEQDCLFDPSETGSACPFAFLLQ